MCVSLKKRNNHEKLQSKRCECPCEQMRMPTLVPFPGNRIINVFQLVRSGYMRLRMMRLLDCIQFYNQKKRVKLLLLKSNRLDENDLRDEKMQEITYILIYSGMKILLVCKYLEIKYRHVCILKCKCVCLYLQMLQFKWNKMFYSQMFPPNAESIAQVSI